MVTAAHRETARCTSGFQEAAENRLMMSGVSTAESQQSDPPPLRLYLHRSHIHETDLSRRRVQSQEVTELTLSRARPVSRHRGRREAAVQTQLLQQKSELQRAEVGLEAGSALIPAHGRRQSPPSQTVSCFKFQMTDNQN